MAFLLWYSWKYRLIICRSQQLIIKSYINHILMQQHWISMIHWLTQWNTLSRKSFRPLWSESNCALTMRLCLFLTLLLFSASSCICRFQNLPTKAEFDLNADKYPNSCEAFSLVTNAFVMDQRYIVWQWKYNINHIAVLILVWIIKKILQEYKHLKQ